MTVTEPNGLLTLRQALRLTLSHHPRLKAVQHEIGAARGRHRQAGLWENPELEIELEDFGGSGELSGIGGAETTIQLSQLIPLGGKITKRQTVYAHGTALSSLDYESAKLDVCAELTNSFIDLLFIQHKQQLSQELVNISKQVAASINQRVQAGKDSPLDLSKARIAAAYAVLQHQDMLRYENVYRKRLASFWAERTPRFSAVTGSLEQIRQVPESAVLENLLGQNPDVVRWVIAVQQRKAEAALARAEAVPDVTVSGGVKYFNELDDTAFVIGLSMPLPVTDRNQGGRIEARENLKKVRQEKDAAMRSVWNELDRLCADLQTAYTKAHILQNDILKASEEVFNGSRISYEEGKIDYLALLDAQRVYFESRSEYLDTLRDYHLRRTELERLIGQRLDDLTNE